MDRMKTILVTGGSGGIESNICLKLFWSRKKVF